MSANEKLCQLREHMSRQGIDVYIITKNDPHQSENTPDYWNEVCYMTGFTGSAGTAVVTAREAGLWTDGRYYIQAMLELAGSGFKLYRAAEPDVKDFPVYAKDAAPPGGTIGFNGRTFSVAQALNLSNLVRYKRVTLKSDCDLVGEIWQNRPALSKEPIFDHDVKFCGASRGQKLEALRQKMRERGADIYILSSTDDIAWLYNLRGRDMPGKVFFEAFASIDYERAVLFTDLDRTAEVRYILSRDGVILKPLDEARGYAEEFCRQWRDGKPVALLNPEKTGCGFLQALAGCDIQHCTPDLTAEMKAVKNETELANLTLVNIRDGVAMVRFERWLRENVQSGKVTEWDIARKVSELRGQGENFFEPSFPTIAAYEANAAMMHYTPKEQGCAVIKPEGFLLVDSGGSYYDGTTDITRTYVLGAVSEKMRRDFTLVLKSHIALARVIFLYGATGTNLDVLARVPMWDNLMDYKSGTGHGIGFFLNVHEGPCGISLRPSGAPLTPGMIITDEPGVYIEGEYGIRTENTLKVVEHVTNAFGRFLKFEVISYCPIDLNGIDAGLLDEGERRWLNDYHALVYQRLAPHLTASEQLWLAEATRAI
ncbi:MAG: aminopeptidase P family protein [Clostridiales bacterium]|jgi:Xaa-Pro aminopeptidase|nr:aminopeptidase P family protein [Clostridiales bacterium]